MDLSLREYLIENYKESDLVGYGINGKTVKISDLIKMDRRTDEYMSVSTLQPYARHRCKEMVKDIKFLFADLDLWHGNTRFSEMDSMQALILLYNEVFKENILPEPTYVFFTGRGFLLLWRVFGNREFSKDVHNKAYSVWVRCQRHIQDKLKDYCSDPACTTDHARIFRVLGSSNGKNGREVFCHTASAAKYNLYDLDEQWKREAKEKITDKQQSTIKKMQSAGILVPEDALNNRESARAFIKAHMDEYKRLYDGPPTKKQISLAEKLSKTNNVRLPRNYDADWRICVSFINDQKASIGPINSSGRYKKATAGIDIMCMSIIENYIKQHPDCVGQRESLLWLYRVCHYDLYQDSSQAEAEMIRLNNMYDEPLSEDQDHYLVQTRSAEDHNDKYVETGVAGYLKSITGLSWEELKSYHERKPMSAEDRQAYNRSYYKKKLEDTGKKTKAEQIEERVQRVHELLEEGKTLQEVADILSVSLRTVKSDKKKKCKKFKPIIKENSLAVPSVLDQLTDLVENGKNVHVDGAAGTGKSYLINEFLKSCEKKVVCVTPSGMAASQIANAQTIHKTFGLSARAYGPSERLHVPEDLLDMEVLIIDEVSMLRFDIFHHVMRVIDKIERWTDRKIGVVLSGDMGQLAPVLTDKERNQLENMWNRKITDVHVTASLWYNRMNFQKIELTECKRMNNQHDVAICKRVREHDLTVLEELNQHVDPGMRFAEDAIHLCAYKNEVKTVNQYMMNLYSGDDIRVFNAKTKGNVNENVFDVPFCLRLYVGMPVCLVVNKKDYKNGTLGMIEKINKKSVRVNVDGRSVLVKYENLYGEDGSTMMQLPLVPAYAITIHKAQGMTIQGKVVVHSPMFEPGMLYTAITRVTDLKNLYFTNELKETDLENSGLRACVS